MKFWYKMVPMQRLLSEFPYVASGFIVSSHCLKNDPTTDQFRSKAASCTESGHDYVYYVHHRLQRHTRDEYIFSPDNFHGVEELSLWLLPCHLFREGIVNPWLVEEKVLCYRHHGWKRRILLSCCVHKGSCCNLWVNMAVSFNLGFDNPVTGKSRDTWARQEFAVKYT